MAKRRRYLKIRLPVGWKVMALSERMTASCCACGEVPKNVRVVYNNPASNFPAPLLYCAECAVTCMMKVAGAEAVLVSTFSASYVTNPEPPCHLPDAKPKPPRKKPPTKTPRLNS